MDPYKATIGVGLGLPGNHPGLADKNILSEVVRQSEDIHIEQVNLIFSTFYCYSLSLRPSYFLKESNIKRIEPLLLQSGFQGVLYT